MSEITLRDTIAIAALQGLIQYMGCDPEAQRTENQMLRTQRLGKHSLKEIKDVLAAKGLTLKGGKL